MRRSLALSLRIHSFVRLVVCSVGRHAARLKSLLNVTRCKEDVRRVWNALCASRFLSWHARYLAAPYLIYLRLIYRAGASYTRARAHLLRPYAPSSRFDTSTHLVSSHRIASHIPHLSSSTTDMRAAPPSRTYVAHKSALQGCRASFVCCGWLRWLRRLLRRHCVIGGLTSRPPRVTTWLGWTDMT